jgi:hypothetical protein
MQAFKIKKQIDSDMLYLPEFKNMLGRNAEIIILTESDESADKKPGAEKEKAFSASALLKYAGSWSGDDFEDCLENLYLVRGKAEF